MLHFIWNYVINNYNQWEILYLTLIVILISELPVILFTFFDIFKFNYINNYRLTYFNKPIRPYPSNREIMNGLYWFLIIVFCVLIPFTYINFLILEYIQWMPYDLSPQIPETRIFISHFILITFFADLLFYFFHRIAHSSNFYWLHKHHHIYKYNSFSLVNHCLHPLEIIIFIIPPAIPPILLKSHITVVWIYAIIANWLGIYIHSGYEFKLLEKIILINSRDHDSHHINPTKNFSTGIFYSIIDRMFGTYIHIPK